MIFGQFSLKLSGGMKDEDDIAVAGKTDDFNKKIAIKNRNQYNLNDCIIPENENQTLIDYCVMDFSGKRFSCIYHGNCFQKNNCFKSEILQENLDFHKLQFHPGDRILWCEKAFPDILKFIESESNTKIPDFRFIFNHRYIRDDGSITQFMHEGSISFEEDKLLPLLKLKVFFEIEGNNPDDTIVLTIFKYSVDNGYQQIFTRTYGVNTVSVLSERELEVIRLCYEGFSSKMIAEKLNLSFHTVKNHKRNCMEKTKTHNITKLIHFCLKNNWL